MAEQKKKRGRFYPETELETRQDLCPKPEKRTSRNFQKFSLASISAFTHYLTSGKSLCLSRGTSVYYWERGSKGALCSHEEE